jgi:hypothetical protein
LSFSWSLEAMSTLPPRDTTCLASALPIPDEPPTTTTDDGWDAATMATRRSVATKESVGIYFVSLARVVGLDDL